MHRTVMGSAEGMAASISLYSGTRIAEMAVAYANRLMEELPLLFEKGRHLQIVFEKPGIWYEHLTYILHTGIPMKFYFDTRPSVESCFCSCQYYDYTAVAISEFAQKEGIIGEDQVKYEIFIQAGIFTCEISCIFGK